MTRMWNISPSEIEWDIKNLEHIYASKKKEDFEDSRTDYYQTMGRSGIVAYIPKKFVKVLYYDNRENDESLSPFDYDPTDYRPKEPLPNDYPLVRQIHRKGSLAWGLGSSRRVNYPYPSTIVKEKFNLRYGGRSFYITKVESDIFNRFYIGISLNAFFRKAVFTLETNTLAEEFYKQMGIGIYLSYDFYRTEDYILTSYGIFSFNRSIASVSQTNNEGEIEERDFSGFIFSPHLGNKFQWREIAPDLDFYVSTEFQFSFPYTLRSDNPTFNRYLWRSGSDRISVPFGGHFNIFIGFQSTY